MSEFSPVTVATVRAPINFLGPMPERPVKYQYEPPAGVPALTGEYVPHIVPVRNARPLAAKFSLDREGFELVHAPSDFADFGDEEAIRRHYYREVERFLETRIVAAKVLVFDHNIRNASRAAAGEAGIRGPVERAHNDFTAQSGVDRARQELKARGVDFHPLFFGNFALVNLWRPIGRPVEKSPLALCDATTVEPEDLVESDLVYPDRVGEIYSITHNSSQRWHYFPRLKPDEAILIKSYDSRKYDVARFTPHAAFDDPTSRPDAPDRESIEVRALVFYPD